MAKRELRSEYETAFMSTLAIAATTRRHTNVLSHMLGHLKKQLDSESKQELVQAIEDYRHGRIPLVVPLTLMRHHVRVHGVAYLAGQTYLAPHPRELMLRNSGSGASPEAPGETCLSSRLGRSGGRSHRARPVVGRAGRPPEGTTHDLAAVEEPLEVRLHGKPFAVIMRTPGEDRALAAGFLLSEGVVRTADDIGAVEHCRHPDRPDGHNVVDVYLLGESRSSLDTMLAERRKVLTNSSCGLCGRLTIDSLKTRASALPMTWTMTTNVARDFPTACGNVSASSRAQVGSTPPDSSRRTASVKHRRRMSAVTTPWTR